MAQEMFIITQNFKSPEVYQTGYSHSPAKIGWRLFRKGEIVKGELKTSNGKPAFVLVGRMNVVPLTHVRKLVTKQVVNSSFAGEDTEPSNVKKYMAKTEPKIQYMDAVIIGALIGGLGWYFAEKKGWVDNINTKNRLYAALVGSALTTYFVYRYNNHKRKPKLKTK